MQQPPWPVGGTLSEVQVRKLCLILKGCCPIKLVEDKPFTFAVVSQVDQNLLDRSFARLASQELT